MRASLSFQKERCLRCHGERIIGAECANCGARPRNGEVNASVVRRRQRLARVDTLGMVLAETDARAPMPDANDLTEMLQALLEAVEAFLENPGDVSNEQLAFAIHRLRRGTKRLADEPLLRPGMGTHIALHDSSVALLGVWDIYRCAMTTASPLEAQQLATRAQGLIDTVSKPIATANRFEAAARILDDHASSPAERIFAAVRLGRPDASVDSLMQTCAQEASRTLGRVVGRNSGLAFATLEILGDARFDPRALRTKLLVAARVADSPRIAAIAEMNGAVERLAGSRRDSFEAFLAFQAVLGAMTDKRALVRQTGKMIANIYESAQPLFAWYALLRNELVGPDQFTRAVGENAANLAVGLANGVTEPLFADAPRFLRDAPHHGRAFDYDEHTDEVAVSLGSFQGRMPLDEYVDRALAFVESVLAAAWGLENALECAQIPLVLSAADALFVGLTPIALAKMALIEVHGLRVAGVTECSGIVQFDIQPTNADLLVPAVVTARALRTFSSEVVIASGAGAWVEFSLDTWPSDGAQAIDQMMNLLRFKEACKVDGESALERTDIRFVAACLAHALSEDSLEAVRHLRELRGWANTRGWVEEAEFCARSIGLARAECTDAQRVEIAEMLGSGSAPVLPRGGQFRIRC